MIRDAREDCGDALVEQRHGGRAVDQLRQRLYQLLCQPRLQRAQGRKELDNLDPHPVVLGSKIWTGEENEGQGHLLAWVTTTAAPSRCMVIHKQGHTLLALLFIRFASTNVSLPLATSRSQPDLLSLVL